MVFLKDDKSYENDDRWLGNIVWRLVNNECFFNKGTNDEGKRKRSNGCRIMYNGQ